MTVEQISSTYENRTNFYFCVKLFGDDLCQHRLGTLADRDAPSKQRLKRHIVETITERITVGKDDIAIDLFYSPDFFRPQLNDGEKATPEHGFIAATSCPRVG